MCPVRAPARAPACAAARMPLPRGAECRSRAYAARRGAVRVDAPAPLGRERRREQPLERHVDETRVAVARLAVGEGELHRLGEDVDIAWTVVAHGADIDAVEDRQDLPEQRARAPRAAGEDLEP